MVWSLALVAHYVGCIAWLILLGLPGGLPNIMGRDFTYGLKEPLKWQPQFNLADQR
jgi:hypothetical protein